MKKLLEVMLLLMGGMTAYAQIPCLTGSLATGVMAFYPFGGGSTNDVSGGGHHMINSGATPTADRFGNPNCAYYFEEDMVCALNDYMHTSPAFLNGFFTGAIPSFSISLWYRPVTPVVPYTFSDYELLLGRGDPGVCSPLHCPDTWEEWSIGLYDCRQAVAGVNQYSTWETSGLIPTLGCNGFYAFTSTSGIGGWHHLAFVYNSAAVRTLFIDGFPYTSSSWPCPGWGTAPLNVGDLVLGDAFTGDLDDIIIYDHALAVTEVLALYGAPACCDGSAPPKDTCVVLGGSLASGLMAFYPFHMGSLADLSGNGHDLNNPTTAVPTFDRHGNQQCAYSFDRANGDYLEILAGGSTFIDNITASDFSVSLWYQPRGPRPLIDYELLLGRGMAGSPVLCSDTWGDWSIGLSDCRKAVAGFDAYSTWETTAMLCAPFMASTTGLWHHLVLAYNAGAGTRDLYVDGTLFSTITGPCGPMTANIGELMLGVNYTGDLDEIAIYNRTLAPAEVQLLSLIQDTCCYARRPANVTQRDPAEQVITATGMKIYPNPAGNKVAISSITNPIRSIVVYTATGAVYGTYHFNSTEVSIDIDKLPVGMYFMKIATDTETTTEKLMKK